MDWSDLATTAVGYTFGLDPNAQLALGLARYISRMYYNRRMGDGLNKRARSETTGTQGVPNVIPGGQGHYMGQFRSVRKSVVETPLSQYGCHSEHEVYGAINSPDVQYFGIRSTSWYLIEDIISIALIRMIMYRHYRKTIVSDDSVLFEQLVAPLAPIVRHINFFTRSKQIDGTFAIVRHSGPIITNTTTLAQVVSPLTTFLRSTVSTGTPEVELYGYNFTLQTQNSGSSPLIFLGDTPVVSLIDQRISVNVTSVVHLQNMTKADNGSTSRDSIGANPLLGSCYIMKGQHIDVDSDIQGSSAWGGFENNLQADLSSGPESGTIIPTLVPNVNFRALPKPQTFRNIIACRAGMRLEPGEIKKDVLKFRYNGSIQRLFNGLALKSPTTANDSVSSGLRFGVVKLFAFEKVVPTGADTVEMNYHIDRYINIVVDAQYPVGPSARKQFEATRLDRILVPGLLARGVEQFKVVAKEDGVDPVAINEDGDDDAFE